MKGIRWLLGLLCGFSLMLVLLITSIEAVVYWTPGYFEKEYTKYQVAAEVSMEMEDLLDVTYEMMAFLRGQREDLHVTTVVDGQSREFFNQREIAHMEDVRDLFIAAIMLRRICLSVIVAAVVALALQKKRAIRILPRAICLGTGIFFGLAGILAGIIATDFSRYFVIFHHIFFSNDLWILDPATDLLINIVPEPFFMDTAVRIAFVFGLSAVAVFGLCLLWLNRQKSK